MLAVIPPWVEGNHPDVQRDLKEIFFCTSKSMMIFNNCISHHTTIGIINGGSWICIYTSQINYLSYSETKQKCNAVVKETVCRWRTTLTFLYHTISLVEVIYDGVSLSKLSCVNKKFASKFFVTSSELPWKRVWYHYSRKKFICWMIMRCRYYL
jgi:hypothetical protein